MKLPVVGGLPQTGFQPLSLGQLLPSLTYHSQITAGSQQDPAGETKSMGDRRMLTKLSEALWNYHSLLLIILTPLLLLPLPLVIGTKVRAQI